MAAPSHTDNKERPSHEAHMIKEEKLDNDNSEEPLLLMMVTDPDLHNNENWYLDFGYSNHMISRFDWLVNCDEKKKSIVGFSDNRVIQAEGTENVLVT